MTISSRIDGRHHGWNSRRAVTGLKVNRGIGDLKQTYDEKLMIVNTALEIENSRLLERLTMEQQRVFVLQEQLRLMEDRVGKLILPHTQAQRVRGEDNGLSKLKTEQVIAIRLDTRVHRLIAADYGVSSSLISRIKLRRVWQHI